MSAIQVTSIDETEIHTWFERNRAHVELRKKNTEETIVEWWDEEVYEAIEDGFLEPKDYHSSAYDYAENVGLLEEVVTEGDEDFRDDEEID